MAYYLPLPDPVDLPPNSELRERPKLPEGIVDAPLVRLYNFLREYGRANTRFFAHYDSQRRCLSLTNSRYCGTRSIVVYIGILLFNKFRLQAMRMCSLGWGPYLKVELLDGNKTLSVSYWL